MEMKVEAAARLYDRKDVERAGQLICETNLI